MELAEIVEGDTFDFFNNKLANRSTWIKHNIEWPEVYEFERYGSTPSCMDGWGSEMNQ